MPVVAGRVTVSPSSTRRHGRSGSRRLRSERCTTRAAAQPSTTVTNRVTSTSYPISREKGWRIEVETPSIHHTVLDRIAESKVGYAPAGLPRDFDVIGPDGKVLALQPGGRHYEDDSQRNHRAELQERARESPYSGVVSPIFSSSASPSCSRSRRSSGGRFRAWIAHHWPAKFLVSFLITAWVSCQAS